MKTFFEFYEQIKRNKLMWEQDQPAVAQPQQPPANTANDTPPEQTAAQGGSQQQPQQQTQDDSTNQLSEPAHDPKLDELIQSLKDAMSDLKPSSKSLVQKALEQLESPSEEEKPAEDTEQKSQGQDQTQSQQAPAPQTQAQGQEQPSPDLQAAPIATQAPTPQ